MKHTPLVGGLIGYLRDPLHKNAVFLIATYGVIGLLGFFFWAIAARHYTPEEVGLATALISAVLLLHTLARLGLDIGLIRFLPREEDKPGMINTSFTLVGLFSMVLALVFVLGVGIWAPALAFIRGDAGYFLAFVLFTGAVSVVALLRQGVFVAFRRTEFSLIIEAIAGLRVLLLVFMVSLGAMGIFYSWGVASCAALIAGILLIFRIQAKYRPIPGIQRRIVSGILHFSIGNYIGESFRELPGFILPLLVVNVLEPEKGAYFYVAWTIASVILMISYATSSSLLAEGSREPGRFRSDVIRAMKFMFLLLVPAILIIFFLGDTILSFFGRDYSENAFDLLRFLVLSGIPLVFNTLYVTEKRIRQEVMPVIIIYAFVALSTIGVGYVLMKEMGLVGIGIAWLSSNCIVAILIGLAMVRRWAGSRNRRGQGRADVST